MATFKDINQLSQKSAVAGTEKLPVSDTEYITPAQIVTLYGGNTATVDFDWNDPPDFSAIANLFEDGFIPVLATGNGTAPYFPAYIDTNAEEAIFFQIGYSRYVSCIEYGGSDWSGSSFDIYSKPSGGIPATDLASAVQTSLGLADSALQSFTETDPVFAASAAHGISSSDITNWNAKQKAITVSSSEPTSSQGSNGDIWIVI